MKRPPTPSIVFDDYWKFAAMRQEIFHQRAAGVPPPWTKDRVLLRHRFTNAYRAADRVSQYLIRNVAYAGDQSEDELVFRIVLFKLFNRISTWELLKKRVGEIATASFDLTLYDSVLTTAFESGIRLYSAAYIMPPAARNAKRKHTTHLQLVHEMLSSHLPTRLLACESMNEAFLLLRSYPGIGNFLAYQLVTDINYSRAIEFSEMEFVMAGPGALSGIRKCFVDPGDYDASDLIRWTADRQEDEFADRGIEFRDLWGRPLQLIDCQNLFCEVDKYARVMHPEATADRGRTRIKQRYSPTGLTLSLWFPPDWGINNKVQRSGCEINPASQQIDLDHTSTSLPYGSKDSVPSQDCLFPLV
jgi:hypothetical protein